MAGWIITIVLLLVLLLIAAPFARMGWRLVHDNEEFATRKLPSVGTEADGRYAGELSGLPEGQYDVKVWAALGDGTVSELTLPLKIERSSEAEMADLSGDRDFLQRLADASGGTCINIDQIDTLPRLISDARLRQPRTAEIDLWDSAYLFLFVISCLVAEWALRKRLGEPWIIATVPGVGYRIDAGDERG